MRRVQPWQEHLGQGNRNEAVRSKGRAALHITAETKLCGSLVVHGQVGIFYLRGYGFESAWWHINSVLSDSNVSLP